MEIQYMPAYPQSSPQDSFSQRGTPNIQMQNPYAELPMPKVGDLIGLNRIEALVGEGGMANVYKVWHEELEVIRAIKILKKAIHQESKERFLTEAKIMADINHPNVVEIYNLGYHNQQIPYIEMEFVEGDSVKKLLERQKLLPVPVALSITYFICQALYFAHRKDYTLYSKVYHGLIHRDIKPENIVVSKAGVVKLMDFGIARPSEAGLHTAAGMIVGTMTYLSPEQLCGKTLDFRSDIFSLGTVLYEMISGNRTFPQKTLQELVNYKMESKFLPITSFGITFPPKIIEILDKCLAHNPEDRFSSAADMAEEVFACLHELTDRSPSDILIQYMHNPARGVTRDLSRSRIPEPEHGKKSRAFWWIGICAAEAVAIGILLVLLLLR